MSMSAIVQFCDDFREEKGEKTTLVGLYDQEMVISEFPTILSKFVMVVNIQLKKPFSYGKIGVFVELNDEEILHGELVLEETSVPGDINLLQIKSPVFFSPFHLKEPGKIKVFVKPKKKKELIGELSFRQGNVGEAAMKIK